MNQASLQDAEKSAILLRSYLPTKEFEDFIQHFHDAVCDNDLVKHYFFLSKKTAVLQDMKRYWAYITPKSALEYRRPASPTASIDIQLPDKQFSELIQVMTKVFRDKKVNPDHVPQLTHEILEMIEESRSQTNDTMPTKLDVKEVDPDKIQYFLKRYKISSEVMPSKAIMAEHGLSHKTWIHLDQEQKNIIVEGKIFIKDAAYDDQIEEIIDKQNSRDSFVKIRLERNSGAQHLLERHSLPYVHGVPLRLFVRYLRRFSMDLDHIHSFDRDSILKSS